MVIQSNLNAINAKNKLNNNVRGVKKSSEKLSSGFRINRAADDAAGLAVSRKMRVQARSLSQAIRNANDGISLVQTAEGALEETHIMLKRMKELAVQSSNGTYTDDERRFMQQEIDALKKEVDRIAEATDFNGIRPLNGSLGVDGYWGQVYVPGQNPTPVFQAYESRAALNTYKSVLENVGFGTNYTMGCDYFDGTTLVRVHINIETFLFLQDSTNDFNITNDWKDLSFEDFVKTSLFDENDSPALFNEKAQYFAERVAAAMQAGLIAGTGDATIEIEGNYNIGTGIVNLRMAPSLLGAARGFNADRGCQGQLSNQFGHEFLHMRGRHDPNSRIDVPIASPGHYADIWIDDPGGLLIQIGDRSSEHTQIRVNISDMTTTGLRIQDLDIANQSNAISALGKLGADGAGEVLAIDNVNNIGTIDHAIFLVSRQRANLGATQNRLEHTVNSLTNTVENITASESQIADTDMASEMLRYTKYNILQQSAQAMLAQANQTPQAILQLLR
jgi:flagellin